MENGTTRVGDRDLGLRDRKGRSIGVRFRIAVRDKRWSREVRDPVGCDPYVVVRVHVTRSGHLYCATPADVEIGLASDPGVSDKAEAEIERRILEIAARYRRRIARGEV